MPTSLEILSSAAEIARDELLFAFAWHVAVAAVVAGSLAGWRPRRRTAALALCSPLASVAAFAWGYDNPFNGAVFALLSVTLFALGLGASREPVQRAPDWMRASGAALVVFAWVYPHFLGDAPLVYLVAAPVGLLPCPTLCLVIGLDLLGGSAGGRKSSALLGFAATAYGAMGVLALGVWLDVVLLAGAIASFASSLTYPAPLAWRGRTTRKACG